MSGWTDEGMLLSSRRHGEGAAIVEMFLAEHGRHSGVVQGGGSRRMAPLLQPGAQLQVSWKARLEDHLGHFSVEPLRSRAGAIMEGGASLAVMGSLAALLHLLPEREAHPGLYGRTTGLADRLDGTPGWHADYVRWELALLAETGFGLDLRRCAVTGVSEGLVWVSPKSGRAVCAEAAKGWEDRLLALPGFLSGTGPAGAEEVAAGLRLTGFFLEERLAPALGLDRLPAARGRAAVVLGRQG